MPNHAPALRRHVPELAIEWLLDAPERRWRSMAGTLCFADISGFTALAERLAQRGRVGGEELVETLGRVFSTMLSTAEARGGRLLKFGGDALLLFFQGSDHARQAASAAVEMRSALRDAARTPTSVGPLKLSMSVGLHSGDVHFFLVGGRHRELLLLGPGPNRVIDAERAANAGEIVVTTETAALLPPASVVADSGLLRWRRAPIPPCGATQPRAASDGQVAQLFPRALGDYLNRAVPEPEHRVACIAFVRFSGTDQVLAERGPDALAADLDDTLATAQDIFDAEGITLLAVDVDQDGGKLFVGSGVPYAQEDAGGAMLRAMRTLVDARLPLPLQAGVNIGHVFAAEVGATNRAAYSAMGDTTNTAARIASKAPAGVVYAHPGVLSESLSVFSSRPADPLTLKGKRAPLTVYEVGQHTGARRRVGLAEIAFVARAQELAAIAAVAADVANGRDGFVLIAGEPGIGKSELMRESLRRAGLTPNLFVRAEPYDVNGFYRPLRMPVRQMLGLGDDASPAALAARVGTLAPALMPQLALIGDAAGIEVDASAEVKALDARSRAEVTAMAMAQLLETAAAPTQQPVVVVVDDAHWCDEATPALLTALARAPHSRPWLWLVAQRHERPRFHEVATREIALGPISDDAIRELVRMASDAAPLRPHEIEIIVQRAGGNPLAASEILRTARELGSVDAVPASLEAAMAVRVDALDTAARRVLRLASVLGRSFPRDLLAELARGEGQALDATTIERLGEFLEASAGGERLRFRSGVLRDATYEALAFRTRNRLHRTIAVVLAAREDESQADSLAFHFSRAHDHPQAWRYARIAADRARQAFANADAARLYRLALDAARRVPGVASTALVEVWRRLGEVSERAGMLEDSLEAYRRALQVAGDEPLLRAELLAARASAKERIRAFKSAIRDLNSGLRVIEHNDSQQAGALRARLINAIAWIRYGQDRPSEALRHARRAADEARRSDERVALGGALIVMDIATLMLEGPGDAQALKEALAIFEELGDLRMQASVRANLGFVCAVAGRWDEGVGWLTAARDQFMQIGDVIRASDPALNLGEMLVKQRRYEQAEVVLRDAIRVLRAARFHEGVNRAEIQLARILIARGEHDAAEAMMARVEHEFSEAGQPLAALEAAVVRAAGRARSAGPEAALTLLDDAERAAGRDAQLLLPVVACERARALIELGRHDQARHAIDAAIAVAAAQGLRYEHALLLLERARLGVDDGVAEAQRTLRELGVAEPG